MTAMTKNFAFWGDITPLNLAEICRDFHFKIEGSD